MIKQEIYIEKEDWRISVFYAVTHYEVEEIIGTMREAGAREVDLARAYDNLSQGNLNTGLCYSGDGHSVLVISIASSPKEFINSLFHEVHHCSSHIAERVGYDLRGEDVCYLAGEIAEKMYPVAKQFLCECRRHNH